MSLLALASCFFVCRLLLCHYFIKYLFLSHFHPAPNGRLKLTFLSAEFKCSTNVSTAAGQCFFAINDPSLYYCFPPPPPSSFPVKLLFSTLLEAILLVIFFPTFSQQPNVKKRMFKTFEFASRIS
jgi:hypothetical protein